MAVLGQLELAGTHASQAVARSREAHALEQFATPMVASGSGRLRVGGSLVASLEVH